VANDLKFAQLSEARQRLVQLAHGLRFGRIEGLVIESGEPELGLPCRVFATRRYGGREVPRPQLAPATVLRAPWRQLFADFDEMGSGRVERLDIETGLPVRASLEVKMTDAK
jgi:hypothetical protein